MSDYATIREHLGEIIGKKVVDVTQHDEAFWRETGIGFVDIMFDSGDVLRVWSMRGDEPWMVLNPDSETPEEIERL